MAKLKPVVLKNKLGTDGTTNIKIRLTHDGKSREIATPYYIDPKFMGSDGQISRKHPNQTKLNLNLNVLMLDYNSILADIGRDIVYMDINAIVKKLRRHQGTGESIIKYMNERIKTLQSEGRISYADTFKATIKWMKAFSGKDDILFKEINLDYFERLERWLLREEKKTNTVRIYLNCIKATLNHVVDNDILKLDLSFLRKFKVKKEITIKKNLDPSEIRKLIDQKLSPARRRALDLWLLSFYLLGINFKDLLLLTPKHVRDGRIHYLRYKTKNKAPIEMSVLIIPEAQAIFDKYMGDKYLLRFIEEKNNKRKSPPYKDITRDTNVLLKKICKQAGMKDIKLSTNFARHSVATIAYKLGIMESTISELLNHSAGQNKITETYIERDTKKIDEAQRLIIQTLKQ